MSHDCKRTGPHPLWLHLNTGAAMMASLSDDRPTFTASAEILQHAMDGVKAYQSSPVKPYRRKMISVSSRKGSRLITAAEWQGKDIVILIPSLINGWEIFDIEQDFSFAAYLQQCGLTPVIVDWEKPSHTDIPMNDYVCNHLKPMIGDVLTNGHRIKGLVGYCMGGTIIAALLSAFPELRDVVGRQALIAPPWDFSYQSVDQVMRLQTMAMQTYAMGSPVPNDFVQSLFWAIDPLQILKKFRRFPNVNNRDRFVRVEDWLNAQRPVSLSVIQTCLFDWYRDNKIIKGEWIVNGHIVSSSSLGDGFMIAGGAQDNLVPEQSFASLLAAREDATYIRVETGHIGLMASDKSKAALWKPIADFLKKSNVV